MGTVVHSEAQEGNKYILTLIMKAIVAYALAAFAAIAATPNPIEATPLTYRYSPVDLYPAGEHAAAAPRAKREYDPIGLYEDIYDYAAAPAKHGTYSEPKLHDERLTKREDLDTYLDAEADPR